ncbi:hypothetical protein WMY93_014758 [Mugilogobius chulae]|uniref:B30.2/SPRY domain-containing protein n=1 Tax=Mugilogobius chulae TaxID=88201 RepID=A0AAW0NWA4_9GOBI
MRHDFVHVTLDRNTAHTQLLVSEDKLTATLVREKQPYPDHPDRYKKSHQILGSQGLRGRAYFEVKWNDWVDIAMTYKRNGESETFSKGVFGDNNYSWSLRIYDGDFYICHGNVQEPIRRISAGLVGFSAGQMNQVSASFISGIVGVFLDYDAGILSFYEILNEGIPSHLYTFRNKFTQPLFPGFGVWIVYAQRSVGNSVSLVTRPRISFDKIHAGAHADSQPDTEYNISMVGPQDGHLCKPFHHLHFELGLLVCQHRRRLLDVHSLHKSNSMSMSISHSDVFTFHMMMLEMLLVLASALFIYGFYSKTDLITNIGILLVILCVTGQTNFHCLTCVDRYLAVVHPITYLRLKKRGGVTIRNIGIGVAWLLSCIYMTVVARLSSLRSDSSRAGRSRREQEKD